MTPTVHATAVVLRADDQQRSTAVNARTISALV
jgi:hypothetical protein